MKTDGGGSSAIFTTRIAMEETGTTPTSLTRNPPSSSTRLLFPSRLLLRGDDGTAETEGAVQPGARRSSACMRPGRGTQAQEGRKPSMEPMMMAVRGGSLDETAPACSSCSSSPVENMGGIVTKVCTRHLANRFLKKKLHLYVGVFYFVCQ